LRLSELADSVLLILAGRCRHADIAVQREYPTPEPVIQADAEPLRQVLMNLMVNAIEAMPTGGTLSGLAMRYPAFLNVKDYGAIGNGVADDTAAIQAAITAIGATTGGTIYFPQGTYLVSTTLSKTFNPLFRSCNSAEG
jgi:signal transduction histidine kinase